MTDGWLTLGFLAALAVWGWVIWRAGHRSESGRGSWF
jgi:hypothetical protein